MAKESIRSPFYEIAASLGATFMEESGWYWTEGFGDEDAEYLGVREDLGVWDVSRSTSGSSGSRLSCGCTEGAHGERPRAQV